MWQSFVFSGTGTEIVPHKGVCYCTNPAPYCHSVAKVLQYRRTVWNLTIIKIFRWFIFLASWHFLWVILKVQSFNYIKTRTKHMFEMKKKHTPVANIVYSCFNFRLLETRLPNTHIHVKLCKFYVKKNFIHTLLMYCVNLCDM